MKLINHQFLFLLIIICLVACSDFDDYLDSLEETFQKVIIADDKSTITHDNNNNSYIVAFKNPYTFKVFNSFKAEFNYYYLYINKEFEEKNLKIKNINFITSINLTALLSKTKTLIGRSHKDNYFKPIISKLFDNKSSQIALIAKVDFKSKEDAITILKQWEKEDKIYFAEPNYQSSLFDQYWAQVEQKYKNISQSAYWYKMIKLSQALNYLATSSQSSTDRPIVAVLDSGVDVNHPFLKDQIWQNNYLGAARCGSHDLYGCNTTAQFKDSLGNGDVYPVGTTAYGQSCPNNDAACIHGTHVAGIIAGLPSDTYNIGGICPICKIMVLKIVDNEGKIFDSAIIAALKYISFFEKDNGTMAVRVINASFGKYDRSRAVALLIKALNNGINGPGAIIVAAAGNEDSDKFQYPAAFPEVIAVSNITENYTKSISSNFGHWVDIAAPGTNIDSYIPGTELPHTDSGTSMAAPIVTAVAGLLIATNPSISIIEAYNRILKGSDPLNLYNNEVNKHYAPKIPGSSIPVPLLGLGIIDAYATVSSALQKGHYPTSRTNEVSKSCATINTYFNSNMSNTSLIILFLLPLMVIAIKILINRKYKL